MINYLESSYIDTAEKMRVFNGINTPEGLESKYRRIVSLILASGRQATVLASSVLMEISGPSKSSKTRSSWPAQASLNGALFTTLRPASKTSLLYVSYIFQSVRPYEIPIRFPPF